MVGLESGEAEFSVKEGLFDLGRTGFSQYVGGKRSASKYN